MPELSPDLIRRVLVATASDYSGEVYWSVQLDGSLRISLDCSDFFALATADSEPIETQDDVELLEDCLTELIEVEGTSFPTYLTELYAVRRRKVMPRIWTLPNASPKYLEIVKLFQDAVG